MEDDPQSIQHDDGQPAATTDEPLSIQHDDGQPAAATAVLPDFAAGNAVWLPAAEGGGYAKGEVVSVANQVAEVQLAGSAEVRHTNRHRHTGGSGSRLPLAAAGRRRQLHAPPLSRVLQPAPHTRPSPPARSPSRPPAPRSSWPSQPTRPPASRTTQC